MTATQVNTAPATEPPHVGRVLRWAVWFGLVGGLAELGMIAMRKTVLHRFVFLSPYVVWMAPVTDAFLAAVPVLIVLLLTRARLRRVSLRAAAFLPAFVACLGPLFMYGPLHRYAAVILAAGMATQLSRLVMAHLDGFEALVRRTMIPLVIVILGLTATVYGRRVLAEHQAITTLRSAPPSAPNVLLIVLDTVRAENLSVYGYGRQTTPQLEQFAATAVRFDNAIATAPWTLPSHASMFTGRPAHELSANWITPLDAAYPTLAEVLSRQGYLTAGFVGNINYCSRETGLDRGFQHYEDLVLSPDLVVISSALGLRLDQKLHSALGDYNRIGHKNAPEVNREFLDWLAGNERRPSFVFLNYWDAHAPHLPPAPFDRKFGPGRPPGTLPVEARSYAPGRQRLHSSELVQREIDAYDGSIAYLDDQIGRLLTELKQRGWLENTLTIITSDHGEEFTEHGVYGHGDNLYLPVLRVPLLISFPARVPAGTQVREAVSLRDLPATIVDLLKLYPDIRFPGRSLARYWTDRESADSGGGDPLLSELSYEPTLPQLLRPHTTNKQSLIRDRYHYIKSNNGREELFDWQNDPSEQHDLAGSEDGDRLMQAFRISLDTVASDTP